MVPPSTTRTQLLLVALFTAWAVAATTGPATVPVVETTVAETTVAASTATTAAPTTTTTDVTTSTPAAEATTRGPLAANKCCPLGEDLVQDTPSTVTCAPPDGQPSSANGSRIAEESVSALLARLGGATAPDWLLENATLTAAATGAFVRYGAQPACDDADREMIPSTWRTRFRALGGGVAGGGGVRLQLQLSAWGGAGAVDLPPEDFCVDRVRGTAFTHLLLACPCRQTLCVRKCCRSKQVFAERLPGGVGECALPTAEEAAAHPRGALKWRPSFKRPDRSPVPAPPPFHLLTQPPLCAPGEQLVLLNDAKHDTLRRMWAFENGSALLEHFGWGSPFGAGRWCGETLLLGDGRAVENAVFCLEVSPPAPPPVGVQTYGALFLVGACFLALTLGVYAALPKLREPPHAKALMCHCAALLVASVTLACMQLTPVVPDEFCEFGAMTIQFSFLAAFFWLNVLCIDISWTFSGLRGLMGSLLDTSRRKFLYYSLYAWGSPLIITTVTVGMHIAFKHKALPQWVIVPNFGGKECWFYGEAAHWAYFYGPMAVLLAANAALFVFTAARLAVAQCDAAQLNRGDSVRHDLSSRLSSEKRRFILYTKLFLLMGVTWALEVVSWSARQDKNVVDVDPAWFFTDILNTLRGVFIFVIFCCKRKVVQMLRKRAGALGLPGGVHPGSSTRSPTATSTRQTSLLQLSPLSEAGLAGEYGAKAARRASPTALVPLSRANGAKAPSWPHSQPPPLVANGSAVKAPRPSTQPPPPNTNGAAVKAPRHSTQPPPPNTNGAAADKPPRLRSLSTLSSGVTFKMPDSEAQSAAPNSNGVTFNIPEPQYQSALTSSNGGTFGISEPRSQSALTSSNRMAVKELRSQIQPASPRTNDIAAPRHHSLSALPKANGSVVKTSAATTQFRSPPA